MTPPSVDWPDERDARRMTTTEQIIWAHRVDKDLKARDLEPGTTLRVYADLLPASDGTAPFAIHTFNQITGGNTIDPRQAAIANDHFVFTGVDADDKQTGIGREFARLHGIEKPYYATPGDGIFHFYFPEQGLVMPGQFIPGADSHSRAYGAYGAVGIGVGSTTLGFGWSTGYIYVTLARQRRVVFTGTAAAVGQREGHRARAAAAVGREAVAGDVGGARGCRRTAADRLPQHDREHDGRGRGAQRHLRRRRRSPTSGIGARASRTCRIRAIRPGADAVYDIDETLDLADVRADDREAVQPGERVSGRGGGARAPLLRQGDDRLVHQRQLRRSAAGRARAPGSARAGDRESGTGARGVPRIGRGRPPDRDAGSAARRRVDRRRSSARPADRSGSRGAGRASARDRMR